MLKYINSYTGQGKRKTEITDTRKSNNILFFAECSVYAFIFFFLYDVIWVLADWNDFEQSLDELYIELPIDFTLCVIFSFTNMLVNKWLYQQDKIATGDQMHKKMLLNGLTVLVFNLFIAAGCEFLLDYALSAFYVEDIWGTSFLFGLIASLIGFIHLSIHFSDIVIFKGKENLALQKKFLKLQLDPHFVFNSLSSLAGMIEEEPKKAEDYIVSLSHIYRYILQHIDEEYSTINKGIEFIKNYVDMLNIRYNDNVTMKIENMYEEKDEYILSLSLQLLIENAVKHNSPSNNEKLQISISRENEMFIVKNNLIYTSNKEQAIESYQIGINNLKQRYEFEGEDEPILTFTDNSFIVKLPIIKKTIEND